ncbi:AraC family transcriptional regulator [Lentzea tibetensis]|uniref:AraC family transcriptional regulator n=1 Tax=Lentzea tibetensis TaxID=2591470 RepID=A0A563EK89_9PSEU|nr:AraC family transcriptional regulator [Lentzea tibetensis]TWP47378.1 AraC family transcriptional regulator [Lentzea tibetensis]
MTDPLGEALHLLRMSGTFYCRSELTEPWGLTLPPMADCLWFHVLTHGRCSLEVDGDLRELKPGDVLLVPGGEGHRMGSGPDVDQPVVVDLPTDFETDSYAILRHGGGGEPTDLVCGAVRFDDPAARHLVGLLPKVVYVEASDASPMRGTLDLMAAEARQVRPGGEAVITRLSDVLVIQAIRSWLEHDPAARRGWLGALQDEQIGRALALIHRDPARPWTVAALARELAMSRSAFAARFTELVGEPAMKYVTRWRMQVALNRLQEGITVSELAHRLGYQSEAAFSRAFKRIVGISPGSARAT